MTTTADTLVPDALWRAIESLLPIPPPRSGGRPRVDDRAALAGIIYVLRTGVPWRLLPTRQLGCGSPVTCWRRLRDWQRAGVWQQLHHVLLDQLGRAGQLDEHVRRMEDSVERVAPDGRLEVLVVAKERVYPDGCVMGTRAVQTER